MLKKHRRDKLINRIKGEISKTNPNYKHIENIICEFEKENLSLIDKMSAHKRITLKKINGSLKQTIHSHGPITTNFISSASKRIYGSLKNQNINLFHDLKKMNLIKNGVIIILILLLIIKLI